MCSTLGIEEDEDLALTCWHGVNGDITRHLRFLETLRDSEDDRA
jgi:hypothetical protein